MSNQSTSPQPTLQAGAELHGFKVLRVQVFPEIRVTAYEIEHKKTGAKVLHLHSFDRENLYAIGFRTPPTDSTGVPHILEHSVLAGSEKYPLKDVFKELMRSTLQTFINAFTYPDKTVYPVASQIKTDFFNLARVYTDLVLHPRLLKETFLQEGHHLELSVPDDLSSDLIISGIVYNEMKGAYSSPDSLMYKAIQENLYPDSVYAFDSGGDPDVIPALTYEQFCEFHRAYYSPTNARFFIYGDITTEEHLAFLSEMLSGFDRVNIDSSIRSQKRLTVPLSIRNNYPVGKDEPIERKTMVNVAWMMSENTDHETSLILEIIAALLVGSAASPLRKALIDSGLGEDLTPISGIEADLKQLMFCAGLRNTQSSDAQKIEQLIFDTIKNVVKNGFDKELIEGVLHQVEIHGKEIIRSSYPYGILLMGNVFQTWLYDGDPLIGLDFPKIIESIRQRWAADLQIFQKMTKKWLLDNPHRILAIMEPDPDFNEKKEKIHRDKMAKLKASLTKSNLAEINTQAAELKKFQSEPDSPQDAATIPKLKLEDIPRSVETIPSQNSLIGEVTALEHDIFTNGIAYVDLAFDTAHVPEELQPYLPLMGKIITGMGAAGFTYEEMAKRIALKMGGFGYDLATGFSADAGRSWQKMAFSFSALYRNLPEATNIVSDVICAGDLSAYARMRDLISERKNNLQSAIVPSGHIFAKMAAGAALSLPAYRDEQWHGRTQLKFVQKTANDFELSKQKLREKLEELRKILFNKENLTINITAEAKGLKIVEENILQLLGMLPASVPVHTETKPTLAPVYAGISIPAQVSYVACVLQAPAYINPASALLMISAKELSNNYLYKHIRVQGGAYGGMSSFDSTLGLFSFISYRDPHIVETLRVFKDAQDFYSKNEISSEEMKKAIISTIGMLDKPLDPAGRGHVALIRSFAGINDDMRQQFRDNVLSATPQMLKNTLADYFSRAAKSAAVAVYSAPEKLSEANTRLEEKLRIENIFET
ncbi:putative zinc metalloprotease [hydrocarbon metagenome]|uniref:Putative zinc metalloprotease n=1 Tax=hydrocarbon metagenome TaxID=938273 RepID=A0A0W8FRC0_9ZZZZ